MYKKIAELLFCWSITIVFFSVLRWCRLMIDQVDLHFGFDRFVYSLLVYKVMLTCESEMISMSRAWDKEKIWNPDRIRTYDLPLFLFESCRGLRFFPCSTLVTCWSFHFHICFPCTELKICHLSFFQLILTCDHFFFNLLHWSSIFCLYMYLRLSFCFSQGLLTTVCFLFWNLCIPSKVPKYIGK